MKVVQFLRQFFNLAIDQECKKCKQLQVQLRELENQVLSSFSDEEIHAEYISRRYTF